MGQPLQQIHFVNRHEEIEALMSWTAPNLTPPGLVFLRAPSGIGKSSLADQLLKTKNPNIQLPITIDPDIRARDEASSVFEGFFIQKVARAINNHESLIGLSYSVFARKRGWDKIKEKDPLDLVRTAPGFNSLWQTAADYIERIFGIGHFSAEKLLESDDAIAVGMSRMYLREALKLQPIIMTIREAQHIDGQSLSFLLEQQRIGQLSLIIEYTSDTKVFLPRHAKRILPALDGHQNAKIFDLQYLEQQHLEFLLNRYTDRDIELTGDYYARWDGNLRTLTEIRYRVAIADSATNIDEVKIALLNFKGQLNDHLSQLSRHEQVILSILAAHEDEMPKSIILETIQTMIPGFEKSHFDMYLTSLMSEHRFVRKQAEEFSLDNEDLTSAILNNPEFRGLLAMVRARLRDVYLQRLENSDYLDIPLFACLRRSFRFCSETGDLGGLLKLTEQLSVEVARSNDQSKFVAAIAVVTSSNSDFVDRDSKKLIGWASDLAYDIANFDLAVELLEKVSDDGPLREVMYANSLMEVGKHHLALNIVREGKRRWSNPEVMWAFELTEGIIFRSQNDRDRALKQFQYVIEAEGVSGTVWQAFALRFLETVNEFDTAIPLVIEAAGLFEELGYTSASGYTRLTAAAHLSRSGQSKKALEEIDIAEKMLSDRVHDRHILYNNRACTIGHFEKKDFTEAIQLLETARSVAGDDFSRAATQSNSAAIYAMAGDLERARAHADHSVRILDKPGFGDLVVHYPVLFNASVICSLRGEEADAQALRNQAITTLPVPLIYADYWNVRLNKEVNHLERYQAMLNLPFHFIFLSHWQLDREALIALP